MSWITIKKDLETLYRPKHIVLLGFGREGMSTYRLLRQLKLDFPITIMDQNPTAAESFLKEQEDRETVVLPTESYLKGLEVYDVIFKTPGLPGFLLEHIDSEKITSQSQLFLQYMYARTIGITGTKGKSTTSSILKHVLEGAGLKVKLIGNIGYPALETLLDDDGETYYVYEMSSFQTEFLKVGPRFRVILNLFQEHLNNYKGYDEYQQSKIQLFRAEVMDANAVCIYGCDNSTLLKNIISFQEEMKATCAKRQLVSFGYLRNNELQHNGYYIDDGMIKYKFGDELQDITSVNFSRQLLGEHNLINCLVSFIIVDILRSEGVIDITQDALIRSIGGFKGLKHRLENIGTFRGITFYNDSISTIPEAALKAIDAIENIATLIIGGFDRTIDYSEFAKQLQKIHEERAIEYICLPTTGHKIATLMGNPEYCHLVEDMEEAIHLSYEMTPENHACLLSPAASSFNQYKNFEDRGEHFTSLVQEIGRLK